MVTDAKRDDGFDLIYVSWDHDHWKYNDQPDGWTYPAHFKVLETSEPDEVLQGFIAQGQERPEDDRRAQYREMLQKSFEKAKEADGFLLLCINHESFVDGSQIAPYMFAACMDEQTVSLLEAHCMQVAAQMFQEAVLGHIREE